MSEFEKFIEECAKNPNFKLDIGAGLTKALAEEARFEKLAKDRIKELDRLSGGQVGTLTKEQGNWFVLGFQECGYQMQAQLAAVTKEKDEARATIHDLRLGLVDLQAKLKKNHEQEEARWLKISLASDALQSERDKLARAVGVANEKLQYIVSRGYTGAEYVAREALAEIDNIINPSAGEG